MEIYRGQEPDVRFTRRDQDPGMVDEILATPIELQLKYWKVPDGNLRFGLLTMPGADGSLHREVFSGANCERFIALGDRRKTKTTDNMGAVALAEKINGIAGRRVLQLDNASSVKYTNILLEPNARVIAEPDDLPFVAPRVEEGIREYSNPSLNFPYRREHWVEPENLPLLKYKGWKDYDVVIEFDGKPKSVPASVYAGLWMLDQYHQLTGESKIDPQVYLSLLFGYCITKDKTKLTKDKKTEISHFLQKFTAATRFPWPIDGEILQHEAVDFDPALIESLGFPSGKLFFTDENKPRAGIMETYAAQKYTVLGVDQPKTGQVEMSGDTLPEETYAGLDRRIQDQIKDLWNIVIEEVSQESEGEIDDRIISRLVEVGLVNKNLAILFREDVARLVSGLVDSAKTAKRFGGAVATQIEEGSLNEIAGFIVTNAERFYKMSDVNDRLGEVAESVATVVKKIGLAEKPLEEISLIINGAIDTTRTVLGQETEFLIAQKISDELRESGIVTSTVPADIIDFSKSSVPLSPDWGKTPTTSVYLEDMSQAEAAMEYAIKRLRELGLAEIFEVSRGYNSDAFSIRIHRSDKGYRIR